MKDIQKLEHKLHKKPVGETDACLKTYEKLIKQRQKRLKDIIMSDTERMKSVREMK